MAHYDVVVAGGGPAGCMAAKYAALSGARTLILEEHAEIGSPVQCAGLISRRALHESGVHPQRCIVSDIRGFTAYSPSLIDIHADYNGAVVIRRDFFDRELAMSAVRAGADIMTHAKVVAVKRERTVSVLKVKTLKDRATSEPHFTEIRAKVVVGADGAGSIVARHSGLESGSERSNLLKCVQVECAYDTSENAEIFVSSRIAPGFFAWAVPAGNLVARIGLCADTCISPDRSPFDLLESLFRHPVVSKRISCIEGSRIDGNKINKINKISRNSQNTKKTNAWRKVFALNAGVIPIARNLKFPTFSTEKGVLLVGDAAAQVKPVSGGGVFYSIKCGKIAGEKAAEAALSGDMSYLAEYERSWMHMLGREISFGLRIHKLRCRLGDHDFDAIFSALKHADVMDAVKEGDMDFPSGVLIRILREILRHPKLLKSLAKIISMYAKL